MRTKRLKMIGWMGALALALANQALASAPRMDGFYESWDHEWNADLMIRTSAEKGAESPYAVITWQDGAFMKASIYRIEELEGGAAAFVQLFQSKDNILSADVSQEATYAAQIGRDPWGNQQITLTPTDFARKIGCKNSYRFVKKSGGPAWESFRDIGWGEFRSRSDLTATFSMSPSAASPHQLQAISSRGGGPLAISEITDGLGVVRARELSAEARDGWALERNIRFVAIPVKKWFLFKPYDEIRLIELAAGQQQCATGFTTLYN